MANLTAVPKNKDPNELGSVNSNLNSTSYDTLLSETQSLEELQEKLSSTDTNIDSLIQEAERRKSNLQKEISAKSANINEANSISKKASNYRSKMASAQKKLKTLRNSKFAVVREKAKNLSGKVSNALNALNKVAKQMQDLRSRLQKEIGAHKSVIDNLNKKITESRQAAIRIEDDPGGGSTDSLQVSSNLITDFNNIL